MPAALCHRRPGIQYTESLAVQGPSGVGGDESLECTHAEASSGDSESTRDWAGDCEGNQRECSFRLRMRHRCESAWCSCPRRSQACRSASVTYRSGDPKSGTLPIPAGGHSLKVHSPQVFSANVRAFPVEWPAERQEHATGHVRPIAQAIGGPLAVFLHPRRQNRSPAQM